MIKFGLPARAIVALVNVLLAFGLFGATAAAEPAGSNRHEADRHFQQGVTFYGEADYRAALVEFTRAYALSPNSVVLFNIGETEYQLRDYAAALSTFDRFLAEAPANDPHRAVAENNLNELRVRVGRLTISTVPSGVEISIGDRVIGRAPVENPIVVGVGQVTVKGTAPGRSPVVRVVDVAAEDDISILLELPLLPPAARTAGAPGAGPLEGGDVPPSRSASSWRVAGWVLTGLLTGGAVTFGLLARGESNKLRAARDTYPADGATIQQLADRTHRFSIVADALGAGAVVVGGLTLYSSLSARKEGGSTRVSLGPGSIALDLTF
jgi:hypothetical protein